ncbi:MAG: diacylglycerol kinase [Candidatus Thorarchaeota archaeon SMTZ-45]|jgi:dihydrofolate reductase|nr:MAG: diacylglycerol kinase [Candidatus Thorarchaeota archaeon SMTZ-45]
MTNYIYIATSLDGFIATNDGGLDWLDEIPNPEKSDFGFAEFMSGIDAILMGRRTFEKVLTSGLWPYEKPVYVLSKSKVDVPKELESKVKTINGNPKELVDRLKELGHQNLYVDGGITIQSFLEEDLIDEMIITRVPVLLGNGIPLFDSLTRRLHFCHKKTELLNEMLVKSFYSRVRE